MSWLDKKYKDQLGEQKFPEAMKKRGWESMQGLLDAEMPTSGAESAAATTGTLYWVGVAAVVAVIVGLPFFVKFQPEAKQDISQPSIPESQIEYNISHQEDLSKESPSTMESTSPFDNDISGNEQPMETQEPEAKNTVSEVSAPVEKETEISNVQASKGTDNTVNADQVIANAVVTVEEKVVANEQSQGNLVQEENISTETEFVATEKGESGEEVIVAGIAPMEEEVEETTDNTVESALDDAALLANEDQPQEEPSLAQNTISSDKELDNEEVKNEEVEEPVIVVHEEEESRTESGITEGQTEELPEIASDENKARDEEEDVAGLDDNTVVNQKSAHLAFLEADDAAPVPNLMTFSKERFAISLWGGYLFTGKVLSGDKELIDQRKESEKPIFTTPTGIGLDYFIDKNWTVGVGVGWAEYGEDVDYTIYNVSSTFDSVSFDGRNDSPSNYPNIVSIDSIRVIDTVNQGHWNYNLVYRKDDSTANYYQGKNTFRFIEVPLTVGYRFGSGRLKPWVKAGVILGLPVEASYTYPQFGTGEFSQESGTSKLAAVQYSGLVQLGVDAYLSRSLSLRINALGSYQLNAVLSDDAIRQRYYRLGLSFGLAYNL